MAYVLNSDNIILQSHGPILKCTKEAKTNPYRCNLAVPRPTSTCSASFYHIRIQSHHLINRPVTQLTIHYRITSRAHASEPFKPVSEAIEMSDAVILEFFQLLHKPVRIYAMKITSEPYLTMLRCAVVFLVRARKNLQNGPMEFTNYKPLSYSLVIEPDAGFRRVAITLTFEITGYRRD